MVQKGRRHAPRSRCLDNQRSRSPAGIFRLPSVRRSRSFACKATPWRRSPGGSGERCRPSPVSCGATPPPGAAAWSIARLLRNGTPSDPLAAQKQAKLALNVALRTYVEERLAGVVVAPSGLSRFRPAVSWKGRRHGPRKNWRWANAWSPEQIARRLPADFPDNETMRISHEAIYQALFIQGRGALRHELTACLRTGRVLRMPRARTRGRGKTFISPEIMISQRPAEAVDRAVPGHWEGDLILGLGSSAIGTLVERMTRFTLLLHLPRMTDYGEPGSREERTRTRWTWRGGGARRHHAHGHYITGATSSVADLGSGS